MNTILITGANNGIGRHIAYAFSKAQYSVLLTWFTDEEAMNRTVRDCYKLGANKIETVQLNLMENESMKHVVSVCEKKFGTVDILVNNAATIVWKNIQHQDFNDIEIQLRTNLEGTIKFTKLMLPILGKFLINIGSKMSKHTLPNLPVYCATKYGLRGFTFALAEEYKNLLIYLVNPGLTSTKMSGFRGGNPEAIASAVYNLVRRDHVLASGSEIDLWS